MSLRIDKRISDLRKEHCGSCRLYDLDRDPSSKEMHDCTICYTSAAKGSYHFTVIRKYRVEGM